VDTGLKLVYISLGLAGWSLGLQARSRGVLPLFSQSFSFYINGLSVKPYIYERRK
jgi:hypothetical protein